ncbi:MAG: ABC transporter ATP-binding protein [Aminivibrio sp.]|jgi:oligopeptide/dipeptide ABC transporter ATP-binding protein
MGEYLLEVKNLHTIFELFRGTIKAVDGVDFTLKEGEILGIVGESGGGKSVTGFSLLGLIDPPGRVSAGEVIFRGENLLKKSEEEMRAIRGKDISMIFQDPMTSLNPLHTVGRQIDEMLALHTDLRPGERRARAVELLAEVGIPNAEDRLESYPHQFSGGMRQRVVIAIALAARPKLIIADEPTTALDVTVQAQILTLMEDLVKKSGSALILITHDLAVVSEMAHRVAVMYCGRIVEEGPAEALIKTPLHPYTGGLLRSIPDMTGERTPRLPQIPGMAPSLFNLPPGCAFAPRCPDADDRCRSEPPPMTDWGGGRRVRCFRPVVYGEGGGTDE